MANEFSRFDAADYLETEADVRHYLVGCQDDGDPALIVAALGDIARARSMTALAKQVGLTRAGLYKALSPEGNPSFATVARVAKALGLRISIRPRPQAGNWVARGHRGLPMVPGEGRTPASCRSRRRRATGTTRCRRAPTATARTHRANETEANGAQIRG